MDTFKTSDRNLSAYFLLQPSLKFEASEVDGAGVVYFVFSPHSEADILSKAFYSRTTQPVQPKDFADSLKSVTDIIYSQKRSKPGGYR